MHRIPWHRGVTRYQWLVLIVAWLGWVFDAMDATIYSIVLQPALHDLLRTQQDGVVSQETVGWYGGIIFSIFLVGWAVGGVVFGVLADRIGRSKTLVITILLYSLFTGMAAFSSDWWHLALYRFLTALGIGGEWAAGAALVAEVWPEEKRTKAASLLQSAWAGGFLAAALVALVLRGFSWRWLFVAGVAPAIVVILVRFWIKEPERWLRSQSSEPPEGPGKARLAELFRPEFRCATIAGSGLAFVAVFGLWGATNWTPTLVRSLSDLRGLDPADVTSRVSLATIALNLGALGGYLAFGPLAERFGRRGAFALMCIGSLVMLPVVFLAPHSYVHVVLLLPVLGFFNNGIFGGFPIYLPELYPTRIRATGAGFCFNVGRALAATGPFLTGFLVRNLGSFGRAASATAFIYAVGLGILTFAPETRGRTLPE